MIRQQHFPVRPRGVLIVSNYVHIEVLHGDYTATQSQIHHNGIVCSLVDIYSILHFDLVLFF